MVSHHATCGSGETSFAVSDHAKASMGTLAQLEPLVDKIALIYDDDRKPRGACPCRASSVRARLPERFRVHTITAKGLWRRHAAMLRTGQRSAAW